MLNSTSISVTRTVQSSMNSLADIQANPETSSRENRTELLVTRTARNSANISVNRSARNSSNAQTITQASASETQDVQTEVSSQQNQNDEVSAAVDQVHFEAPKRIDSRLTVTSGRTKSPRRLTNWVPVLEGKKLFVEGILIDERYLTQ